MYSDPQEIPHLLRKQMDKSFRGLVYYGAKLEHTIQCVSLKGKKKKKKLKDWQ